MSVRCLPVIRHVEGGKRQQLCRGRNQGVQQHDRPQRCDERCQGARIQPGCEDENDNLAPVSLNCAIPYPMRHAAPDRVKCSGVSNTGSVTPRHEPAKDDTLCLSQKWESGQSAEWPVDPAFSRNPKPPDSAGGVFVSPSGGCQSGLSTGPAGAGSGLDASVGSTPEVACATPSHQCQ